MTEVRDKRSSSGPTGTRMGDTIPDGVAASPTTHAEDAADATDAAEDAASENDGGPNVMLPGVPEELNLAIQNYVRQFNALIAQNLGTHPGDIEMTAMSIALTFSAARFVALSPDATPERFLSAANLMFQSALTDPKVQEIRQNAARAIQQVRKPKLIIPGR